MRLAAFALAVLALAAPARADRTGAPPPDPEVLQLLDNTQIVGKIVHYYDGVFVVETAAGAKVDVPRDKIASIKFQLPPPRPELSTPEKTFQRWRDAVLKGDEKTVVDCYALMYQGMVGNQLGQAPEEFKKMQKDLESTKFAVKSSSIKGSTATIKLQKTQGDDSMTAEVHLVLENGEWKLTP